MSNLMTLVLLLAASMGQGQSLDSETDPGEPTGADPGGQSPRLTPRGGPEAPGGVPRRMLWRDGGWTAAMGWSSELGPETAANTVWYQDESPEGPPAEGAAMLYQVKEAHAQTTGYGENMAEDQTLTSLTSDRGLLEESVQKESALSQPQASVVCGVGDSLEHDPCFQVSVSALSQVGDSGAQPASHVPGAQRQEASGKQRDQGGRGEGEAERKERGADDGAGGGDDRRRANSEESIEQEEAERGPDEGAEETTDKGRKKRRRKRGRRGAAEAKLSSSSSTESHVLMDTLAEVGTQSQSYSPTAETQGEIRAPPNREKDPQALGSGAADGGDPPNAERLVATQTRPVAQAVAGRAASQPPCPSESVLREEVDAGTMRLPSQTGDKSMDCDGESIVAPSDTVSPCPGPSLVRIDSGSKEVGTFLHSEGPDPAELSYFTEPVESNISIQPVEFRSQAEKIEATVSDLNIDVDDVVPTELDYGHSGTTESKGAFDAVLLSEQNAESVAAMELNDCSHVEALEAEPNSVDRSVGQLPECVTTIETASPTDVEWLLDSTTETSVGMVAIQHEGAPPVEPPQQGEEAAADVSPLKTQEGTADGTVTADSGHCFGHVEPPRDGPSEDKLSEVKGSEARGGREEMREASIERHSDKVVVAASAKSYTWNKEERKGEEMMESSAEVHDNGENENRREAENRSMDGEDNLHYNEELAATAVAVVTVAVASALAKIELSQRLTDGLTEAELSKESSLTEQTPTQSSLVVSSEHELPLDTTVHVNVCVNQLTDGLQAELACTPPTSKSYACHELSDTEDYCPSDDKVDEEYQLEKVEDMESMLPKTESVPEAHVVLEESPEANIINTELVISEAISIQNYCLDLSQDQTIKASSLVQTDTKTSRDLNEALAAQPTSPTDAQSEGQLCLDDRVPCPVIDTGQGNGKRLDRFDSNATENPGLKECTDDSPGELNCSLSEELLGIRLNPEHSARLPLVAHVLVNESCEACESQGTSETGAAIEPAGEACVTGQEGIVVFVCEEVEGEIHQDGSARGQRLPLESEVCSSGVTHSEIQSKNSYMGAVSCDDDEYCMPTCEVILPVNLDHSLSGTCSGRAHSNPLSKEPTSPVTPDDGAAQPLADMFVLPTPLEFQSSSFQPQGDHSAVMYDGDGVFQDQGGNMAYLDTVYGCKDQEITSNGEEKQRIMVTTKTPGKLLLIHFVQIVV